MKSEVKYSWVSEEWWVVVVSEVKYQGVSMSEVKYLTVMKSHVEPWVMMWSTKQSVEVVVTQWTVMGEAPSSVGGSVVLLMTQVEYQEVSGESGEVPSSVQESAVVVDSELKYQVVGGSTDECWRVTLDHE